MTKQISRKMTVLFLVFAIGFTPVLSYAKNNDNKDKKDREDKQEQNEKNDKNDRSCLKAFGHLFAPGFIKNWGERDFPSNCFLPFGIAKKFRGIASSTPPVLDTTAPIITDLAVKPNIVRATVTWHTSEKSDSTVFWSTSSNVDTNSSTTASVSKNGKTKDHSVVIENLTASTTYFVVVRSRDAASNTATSSVISFQTKPLPVDNTNPVVSSVALLVSTSTINVSWSTNENATSRLYYGTSPSLDVNASTTNFIENLTLTTSHHLLLSGLATSTSYYMAIESKDSSANRTVTPTFTTTTTN